MQVIEVYKLHSFSAQVYSFRQGRRISFKNKSNICTFLSHITVNCIFLFLVAFVIIIVYKGHVQAPYMKMFSIRRRTKMSKAISRRNFLMATGAVGAAGLLAACGSKPAASSTASSAASQAPAASADESLALSDGPVSMTISWWGGDSRHEAYQNAIKEFQAEHTNITIEPTFAAWSGWEEKMAAAFIAGNAQDVCQVNWNWLYNYSADGSKFVDLNTVSNFLDLTQWDKAAMDACYVANSQQCVPVSMTGRIFFWNMTTFNKAGITEVPKTLDDLMAAGKAFQDKLGADYYPLHLGAYDRMILMVFYLESKYGKDWADHARLAQEQGGEHGAKDRVHEAKDRHARDRVCGQRHGPQRVRGCGDVAHVGQQGQCGQWVCGACGRYAAAHGQAQDQHHSGVGMFIFHGVPLS